MTALANFRGAIGSRRSKATFGTLTRRRKRRLAVTAEMLEARCLLAVTSTTPIPIAPTETQSFTGNVMQFTANDAGPFTATINWGDATPASAGLITPSGGGFDVSGTHTYAEDGSFTVTVDITDTADNTSVMPTTTATVGEQSLSITAQAFSVPENSSATVLVARASDPGSPDPGSDFTAMIDWGDGSPLDTGVVTATGGGNYDITGSHVYADEGSFSVSTTFFETIEPGFSVTAANTGTVTEADVLTGGAITLPAGVVEGQVLPDTTQIATFSDTGFPTNTASDFTALINWGDGTPPTAGTVVAQGGGNFAVQGGHTYAEEGPFTLTILVADDAPGTATITITGTVDILNAPLTGTAVTLQGTEGAPLTNVDVATFVDADPLGDADDMVATIDWGDGTVTAGTVVQDAQIPPGGGTSFHVEGSHTYTEEMAATYPVTVTIIDRGDDDTLPLDSPFVSTTTVLSSAQIVQSPLLLVSNSLVSTEGTAIPAGTQLATFTDTGGADAVGDYTATLNWGEGSGVHPAGVIALGQGNFAVVSGVPFTYPDEGIFALTITVTDADTTDNPGAVPTTAQTTATATVNDAALTASDPQPTIPAVTEGQPFSGAVSAFTDANAAATAADFTAQIDWGDGSPTSLGLVTEAAGVFTVSGTHTYNEESTNLIPATYTIVVNIEDDGGSRLTTTTLADVTDATLAAGDPQPTVDAVEGQPFANVPVSYFIDTNPLGTVSDFSVSIDWGVNAKVSPTIGVVQLIGHTAPGAPVSGIIFQVLGSNTYTEEGTSTITVSINDVGGAPLLTTTTTATTVDAPLSSSNGTEITGVEGSPTLPTAPSLATLLGTFTDANQSATIADFTTAPGSAVVNWGDGSAVETLAAANLTALGTPNGVIFAVNASHTYVEEGTYAYTVTVTDVGGSVTIISGSAIIADAALTAAAVQPTVSTTEGGSGGEGGLYPVPEFGKPTFTGPVATFTDGNPAPPTGSSAAADFTATIDWGDGTPLTAGTIVVLIGGASYNVVGSHTYADAGVNGGAGTYPIQVFVVDDGGARLTLTNTATVADRPIVLTGQLNPATDSGVSNTDAITNVTQPDFFGNSEPFSHVTLSATLTGGGPLVQIGQVEAGSDGVWNIVSRVPLADGSYVITATATDQFNATTTTAATVITPTLVIDTVGPVIKGAFFNRLNGEIDYTIIDPGPPSGVRVATLLDSANYLFTKVHANKAFPGKWIATSIIVTPGGAPSSYDVAVVFNSGRTIPGGFYLFKIRDSTRGLSTVQDIAGNSLDGEFYGSFPSGNHINGGDFVAMLSAFHNKIFSPQTIVGTANAANGGNGGPPIGAVHSGNFVTVVPRGGGSVFGADPKHLPGTARKAHHSASKGHNSGTAKNTASGAKASSPVKLVFGKHPFANHINTTRGKTAPAAPAKKIVAKHLLANHAGRAPRTSTPAPISQTPVSPTLALDPNSATSAPIPVTPPSAPPPTSARHFKKRPVVVSR